MNQKTFRIFVLSVVIGLSCCASAVALEETKFEKKYSNFIVTANNAVYGVTNEQTRDGKNIPVELTGEEKVKVILSEFTMKDDVTIDMLKPAGDRKYVVNVLRTEKKISVNLLNKYVQDKNPLKRGKASYLLNMLR